MNNRVPGGHGSMQYSVSGDTGTVSGDPMGGFLGFGGPVGVREGIKIYYSF